MSRLLRDLFISILAGAVVGLVVLLFSEDEMTALVAAGFVALVGLILTALWERSRTRRRRKPAIRGWDSKVTEVTPSPKFPGLWLLLFRLYGPDGKPATGYVTCEVETEGTIYYPKGGRPVFDEVNLQPQELPHYVAFFPESFQGAVREDGNYELRWSERYGLSRRLLADPHPFTIENGRLKSAKPE